MTTPMDDKIAPRGEVLTLDPAHTCLVLVDLQYATGHPETGLGRYMTAEGRDHELSWRWQRIAEYVLPNTARLLEATRRLGISRLYVTYGAELPDYSDVGSPLRHIVELTNNRAGQREHEIIDELKPLTDEKVLNKTTMSAFSSTPIDLTLRTYEATDLIFCGVSTNACVEGTMRGAADLGYNCVLVEDACAATTEAAHLAGCLNLNGLLGRLASTDQVLTALKA